MVQQRKGTFWFDLLLAVVAGVWTIVHLILNFANKKVDDYWGTALVVLFVLALIMALIHYAQERPALGLPWKPGTMFHAEESTEIETKTVVPR